MKRIAGGLIILLLVLCSCGKGTLTWQEQYDLGVKYLSDGNYEEAIIAFTAAIEIDSKQVDTYAKLAEAYWETGNVEAACQILQIGVETTGAEILQAKLDELFSLDSSPTLELTGPNKPAPNAASMQTSTQSNMEDFEIVNGVLVKYVGLEDNVDVVIPDNVVSIGDGAFSRCDKISSVTIPDSVKSIGNCAFEECDWLVNVNIPSGVTNIGEKAFYKCARLAEVTISDSVINIGMSAFENCDSLTNVKLSNSITSINARTFDGCGELSNIIIPDGVTSIGRCAFAGCGSLVNVDIPNGVTSIGDQAFVYCRGLASITIPVGVTNIKLRTFGNCQKLGDVYYGGTSEEWAAIQIDEANEPLESATIHYNSIG